MKLTRVVYGSKDTPEEMREYQIDGTGPVGTLAEYKEKFPEEELKIVEEGQIFVIVWRFIENKGETFDDEERFTGHNTLTTIQTEEVTEDNAWGRIESILETPADYGDGVTNAHILAIYDKETTEEYSMDYFK